MRGVSLFFLFLMLELVGFAALAGRIGLMPVLGWSLISSFFGLLLLFSQFRPTISPTPEEFMRRFQFLIAGVCLFIPGLLTDFLGLVLLIPGVARFLFRRFANQSYWHTSVRWSSPFHPPPRDVTPRLPDDNNQT